MFEGLRPKFISLLIGQISASKLRKLDFIKIKYASYAENFDAAFAYLEAAKVICLKGGDIVERENFQKALSESKLGEQALLSFLINVHAEEANDYGDRLRSFIQRFERNPGGQFILEQLPSADDDYAIRNFLIEADEVKLNHKTRVCVLGHNLQTLFLRMEERSAISPEDLKDHLTIKRKSGYWQKISFLNMSEVRRKLISIW